MRGRELHFGARRLLKNSGDRLHVVVRRDAVSELPADGRARPKRPGARGV